MQDRDYNVAIETSSLAGSVSLGCGDELLESLPIPQPHRHSLELVATLDRLCRRHGLEPGHIRQVYVSIGPGSFTGLRIAVATVKMFARTLAVRIVAVPTIDVVVENAPGDRPCVAVCLSTKRDRMFAALYRRLDRHWQRLIEPALRTPQELCAMAPAPLTVIGDHLPAGGWAEGVDRLDGSFAVPQSRVVWRLGRERAGQGRFTDPANLLPCYARPPEAVELWKQNRTNRPTTAANRR